MIDFTCKMNAECLNINNMCTIKTSNISNKHSEKLLDFDCFLHNKYFPFCLALNCNHFSLNFTLWLPFMFFVSNTIHENKRIKTKVARIVQDRGSQPFCFCVPPKTNCVPPLVQMHPKYHWFETYQVPPGGRVPQVGNPWYKRFLKTQICLANPQIQHELWPWIRTSKRFDSNCNHNSWLSKDSIWIVSTNPELNRRPRLFSKD